MTIEGHTSRSRRWCTPPPILRDPADGLDGDTILEELPGALGILLWQSVRDVMLWADTPPGARRILFADGSEGRRTALLATTELPREVAAPVRALRDLLTTRTRAGAGTVSVSCLEIATWAAREGRLHTAVAFAQAGALASPTFAEAALHTGIHAAAAGQRTRAETWLRRAVNVARREKDRAAYSSALVELGRVNESRGDRERAERFFRLAFRAGRRFAARSARMRAAHGLFRLALGRNDPVGATQFALAAQRVYDPEAKDGRMLLLDLARFWMDLGDVARARAALRRLAPSRALLSPPDRLASEALVARAFAVRGSRRNEIAAGAAAIAWGMMGEEGLADEVRLAAALDLAHGARTAGDGSAFARAKRAILTLAPQSAYPLLAAEIARLWPPDETRRIRSMERAS